LMPTCGRILSVSSPVMLVRRPIAYHACRIVYEGIPLMRWFVAHVMAAVGTPRTEWLLSGLALTSEGLRFHYCRGWLHGPAASACGHTEERSYSHHRIVKRWGASWTTGKEPL
jgi:hypothetical protein